MKSASIYKTKACGVLRKTPSNNRGSSFNNSRLFIEHTPTNLGSRRNSYARRKTPRTQALGLTTSKSPSNYQKRTMSSTLCTDNKKSSNSKLNEQNITNI